MPTAAPSISWLGALGWLTAIAAASFLVTWVLTTLLSLRRTPYIAALALLTGGLTWGYLAWSDTILAVGHQLPNRDPVAVRQQAG